MDTQTENDLAKTIATIEKGRCVDIEQIMELFHDEYIRTARAMAEQQLAGQTLDPMAPIERVYERFMAPDLHKLPNCECHKYVYMATMHTIRRVLVERARYKQAASLAKDKNHTLPRASQASLQPFDVFLMDIDSVLSELARADSQQYLVLELWAFGGLTPREIEVCLDLAGGVVENRLRTARALVRARHKSSMVRLPTAGGNG